ESNRNVPSALPSQLAVTRPGRLSSVTRVPACRALTAPGVSAGANNPGLEFEKDGHLVISHQRVAAEVRRQRLCDGPRCAREFECVGSGRPVRRFGGEWRIGALPIPFPGRFWSQCISRREQRICMTVVFISTAFFADLISGRLPKPSLMRPLSTSYPVWRLQYC